MGAVLGASPANLEAFVRVDGLEEPVYACVLTVCQRHASVYEYWSVWGDTYSLRLSC